MTMMSLWLPILLSSLAVFIMSAILNAVLPWHRNDFRKVPDEDGVRAGMRPFPIPPGEYMMPRAYGGAQMKSPEFMEKMNQGPVMIMTVFPNGPINMGKTLSLWFVYNVIVSCIAACVAVTVLDAMAHTHDVFHITAAVTFIAYVVGLWQNSIWFGRPWVTTLKSSIDGLIYAVITGGIFMHFWA